MKVAVSAAGNELGADASPVFGRCPYYIIVDTESLEFDAHPNPAQSASGGAGIQAAKFITEQGVAAVLTGNVGPNAHGVLSAAGVEVYLIAGGTIQEAVEAFKDGKLQSASQPTASPHAGTGFGGRGRA
jgi:predicted Fe-Mo cluster-binding NifX family protein